MKIVQIPRSGEFKFVLLWKKPNHYIFGDILPYHTDIFEKFTQLNPGDFEIQGGGKIKIKEGEIEIYGKSDHYGKFDKELVEKVMIKYCEERNLKLKIE